jgi:hypothetical protein
MRNAYNILAEKYNSLYTEERVLRQVIFTEDEKKVLTALYDFKFKKHTPIARRIVAAGEVETLVKYSDGTYVCMLEDARGTTKHEYKNFVELTKLLRQVYHVNPEFNIGQTPTNDSKMKVASNT